MNWLLLAVSEWRRRPLRTAVTTAGVGLAVTATYALLAFHHGYQKGIKEELDRLGAHILVVPKGCPYDAASMALHGAAWPCYLKARYLDEVRSVPGVVAAAPVFMHALRDAARENVYVGIDETMRRLRPGWSILGSFPVHTNEVLAGAEVAQRHGWKRGDAVTLPGMTAARDTVAGILAPTHGAEDDFIFLPLAEAQRRFRHEGELSHILIRLGDPNDLDDAVRALRGCDAGMDMNVVPLAHLFHTIQSLVNSTRAWLACIAGIALLIAAAGVSNALLMAVSERTREIGIMRALGASRSDIFRLVWIETVQVCVAGGVLGVAVAFAGSRQLESWLRSRLPFAPTEALIGFDWSLAVFCLGIALVTGSIAGFLPAWRAANLTPTVAMRGHGAQ